MNSKEHNNKNFDFHFIAIGGVGQSALAKILLQLGYKVSGSDIKESKYTSLVEQLGAMVFIGHSENNIQGKPKVVVSSAIKEDNPELIKAKELNLEIIHRSDCLKFISELFPCFIGLSGTHGKTTTSGLLSFILEKMNQNPSYAIGGIIPKLNINANASRDSRYFIAELDESDGTIQKYCPNYLVINNLEADHLDYYKNGLDDIIPVFEKICDNMSQNNNSLVFINVDNSGNIEFLKQTNFKNIKTYSIIENEDNKYSIDYCAKNIVFNELSSSFDVYRNINCENEELLGKINLIIPGKHNIYNALAMVSVLDALGFEFSEYSKYFSEFSGMGRRFQLVADVNDIKIIDDYAHHPAEIQSTLNSIKELKRRKVAIFQPHRYTRLKGLWNDFLTSFSVVDKLYILDTYSAGDKFDEVYNSKNFAKEINKLTGGAINKTNDNAIDKKIEAQYIEGTIDQAGAAIAKELKQGDIVLTLGAGDITKIGGVINDMLSK